MTILLGQGWITKYFARPAAAASCLESDKQTTWPKASGLPGRCRQLCGHPPPSLWASPPPACGHRYGVAPMPAACWCCRQLHPGLLPRGICRHQTTGAITGATHSPSLSGLGAAGRFLPPTRRPQSPKRSPVSQRAQAASLCSSPPACPSQLCLIGLLPGAWQTLCAGWRLQG